MILKKHSNILAAQETFNKIINNNQKNCTTSINSLIVYYYFLYYKCFYCYF